MGRLLVARLRIEKHRWPLVGLFVVLGFLGHDALMAVDAHSFAPIEGLITTSPVEGVGTPKAEKRGRNYLTAEEYNRLLAAAGGNPRDFCILITFLQTGVGISNFAPSASTTSTSNPRRSTCAWAKV